MANHTVTPLRNNFILLYYKHFYTYIFIEMNKKHLTLFALFILLVSCGTYSENDKVLEIKIGSTKSKVIELIGYPGVVKDFGEESAASKNKELVVYDNLATIVYNCDTVVEIVIKNK